MGNSASAKLCGLDILVGDFGWLSAPLVNTLRTLLRTKVHRMLATKTATCPWLLSVCGEALPFGTQDNASLASLL